MLPEQVILVGLIACHELLLQLVEIHFILLRLLRFLLAGLLAQHLVKHVVVEDHDTVFAESTGLRLGGVGPALVIELLEHGLTLFFNIFEGWFIVLGLFLNHSNFIFKLSLSGFEVEFLNVMELGL